MTLIQVILIIFFLFASFKVLGRWRTGELSGGVVVMWLLFWIVATIVALIPDITFRVAHLVGIGRGADLVVYLSLAILFFMVFRLMVKVERINRDITKLTRQLALMQPDGKREINL